MKIEYRNVLKPLYLREYAEAYTDANDLAVLVWVNPPRDLLKARAALDDEYTGLLREFNGRENEADALKKFEAAVEEFVNRSHAWYAAIWSQGEPETRWSAEEIAELNERDPAMLGWLCERTRAMLQEHRERQKNA